MLIALLGVAVAVLVLGDAFVTIVLPKTVSRGVRLTTLFNGLWTRCTNVVARRLSPAARETFLGIVWPLSTIALIVVWAATLMLAFAMIQHGLGTPMTGDNVGFGAAFYMSAATFLTLGYGDVIATTALGRTVSMIEAGTGFGFLALVIGYVPVFYQSFSARERTALLLDARAGAPPTAGELLRFQGNDLTGLRELFAEFERWTAGLLENFLSYPVLAAYRSQHAQLSWLACLTCVTDACAFVMSSYPERNEDELALKRQAAVTFAIGRHLAVDLAYLMGLEPKTDCRPRMNPDAFAAFNAELRQKGIALLECQGSCSQLEEYAAQYEPYFEALADHMWLAIPDWMPRDGMVASWQTSEWDVAGHF